MWEYSNANPQKARMELGILDYQQGLEPMSRNPDYLAGYRLEESYQNSKG